MYTFIAKKKVENIFVTIYDKSKCAKNVSVIKRNLRLLHYINSKIVLLFFANIILFTTEKLWKLNVNPLLKYDISKKEVVVVTKLDTFRMDG